MTVDSAAPAARQHADRQVTRYRAAHIVAVGLLTALMAAGYSVFSLVLNYTFQTSSYDLVIFDEAIRSYAHFHPGISIVKGLHNGFGPHFSILGDHWSPILASLAPLYWIHSSPTTLLVAQAVLFALALPPLWVFTRRAFGGGRRATAAAYLVSVAYMLSWPIASAAAFDFHEVAFAPVLIAVALERLQAGRLRTALIALGALLLVKEDMGLLVAGIGVYLAVTRPQLVPRQRIVALALIVGGVADTWLATYIFIPAFGGHASYYWAYGALGHNVPQVAAHIVTHPVGALRLFITPGIKLDTILWLLAPFCFLSLLSPISIAVIPLLAERMLQDHFPNWWVTGYHYNAYLVIILACGGVDGAARLGRWVAGPGWTTAPGRESRPRRGGRDREHGGPLRRRGDVRRGGVPDSAVRARTRPALVVLPSDRGREDGRGRRRRRAERRHRRSRERARPAPVRPGHRPALGRRRRNPRIRAVGGRRDGRAAVHLPLRTGAGTAHRTAQTARLRDRL